MGNIPHHFLGYWGYGAQHELEALLSSVGENLSPNLSPTRGEALNFPPTGVQLALKPNPQPLPY
jgi:asparagine synthase (glutamine-hydrolysing)